MNRILLSFCMILALFLPFAATAQSTGDDTSPMLSPRTESLDLRSDRNVQPEKTIDPADIPEALMQEVQKVETNCNLNYMYSSFHDCRCIAIKFLDARLKSDPLKTTFDEVYHQVAALCVNEATIAGYIYPSCHRVMKRHYPDTYLTFCRCAANNVAHAYARRPIVNLYYIEQLRDNAFRECGMR